jgi:hypothetical protein
MAATGSSQAAAAAAAAGQGKAEWLLVAGRALHAAASTLLRLHEPPAAAVQAVAAAAVHPMQEPALVGNAPVVLRAMVDCVASIGSLLPATAGLSSAGNTPQYQTELQQLQQQLRAPLDAVLRVADSLRGGRRVLVNVRGYEVLLKEIFPAEVARQLLQLATLICAQVAAPGKLCCANPGCTDCSKLSEKELVSGKGTVCSGCHAVRVCSAECNKVYWKAGHKKACKRLQEEAALQQQRGSSSRGGASSSRSSSSRVGAAHGAR